MASVSVLQTSTYTPLNGIKVRPLTPIRFYWLIPLFWAELKDHNSPEIAQGMSQSLTLKCHPSNLHSLVQYSWLPDVLRLKGSVSSPSLTDLLCTLTFFKIVPRIVGPVLTVTIFATLAAYAWSHGYDISLTNSVVPLLSVVVRTTALHAYTRYLPGASYTGWLDSCIQVSRVT